MSSETSKKKKPKPKTKILFSGEPSLPSSISDISKLIAVLSIAVAVAVTCNFATNLLNRPPKPYCDTFISPDSDDFVSDYCEPCPANGECYDGKFECVQGYKKHGNLCVEDGDISEAAKKISKWVEVHVCEAYAQLLCSGTGKCWVSEKELWSNLRATLGLDEAIYVHAKQRAMKTVHELLETRKDDHGVEEMKCPELLVNQYKPLSCCVRQWIIKHALLLVPACALFIGCILIAYRVYQRHHLSVRAEQLYHEVCDILEEKTLISRSKSGDGEPWVVASWLRDHILSPKERKDPILWRKVGELVQEDSRVDQYPKLVKGESKVVWEWQVEGPLSSSSKRKKSDANPPQLKTTINTSSNFQRRMHAA